MLDRANLFLPSLAAAALFFSIAADARSWGFFVSAARCAAKTASSSPMVIAESVTLVNEFVMLRKGTAPYQATHVISTHSNKINIEQPSHYLGAEKNQDGAGCWENKRIARAVALCHTADTLHGVELKETEPSCGTLLLVVRGSMS